MPLKFLSDSIRYTDLLVFLSGMVYKQIKLETKTVLREWNWIR